MKIGSLFAGYGGLDMAVEQVFPGASPAWFCEWDDAPSKILAHHWPDVPNHRDVTAVDWSAVEPVDILTGGSPCQDLSAAGKRAGMTEGTRSNLWVNMREAINELRPRYVVWENVLGALSAKASSDSDMEHGTRLLGDRPTGHLRALGRVLGDLTDLGYDSRWGVVRASDIGAPHHRARVFLLATPADATSVRFEGQWDRSRREVSEQSTDEVNLVHASYPQGTGERAPLPQGGLPLEPGRVGRALDGRVAQLHDFGDQWGPYGPAIRRWERITRPAPSPTSPNQNGNQRLNAAFAEWMMGLPEGHVTGVDIPRAAQLKAIGNGVCPQQAVFALQQLLDLRSSDLSTSWKVAA